CSGCSTHNHVRVYVFGFIENKEEVSGNKIYRHRLEWKSGELFCGNGIADDCLPQSDIGSGDRKDLTNRSIPSPHGHPEFFGVNPDVVRRTILEYGGFMLKEVLTKHQPTIPAVKGFFSQT